ncbi:hypothetical protein LCGC14_1968640 [marine sediment metagenome]|uniref:Uncharacterized protein n=1 Tax=marine sediment metagenome TaxID=412755 RepID=A0A0F9I9D7_9ZZZZ
MNRQEELQELQEKIDYEGGLYEYILGYAGAGGMPKEVYLQARALEDAAHKLQSAFQDLLDQHNVEPL